MNSNSRHVLIVGGGIVGLAVAAELSANGNRVTLLEKEDRWAAHQTGHNSGVIHAGPYYRPGSLKARMCTAGNRSMVAFARENGIAHQVGGKLIVATTAEEQGRLQELHRRALANGAPARIIDGNEAREYEPYVNALSALRVETTGIIDYGAVSRRLAERAAESGADLRLRAAVKHIEQRANEVVVETTEETFRADLLVNCAGLHSDEVARLAGLRPEVQIVPFRGEYYELVPERRDLVRGLIYPVPDPNLPFLGVHLTRMIDGSVHAGPNAVFAFAREGYKWSRISARDTAKSISYRGFLRMASHNLRTGTQEMIRSMSKRLFVNSLSQLVPDIGVNDVRRAGAGVRAQAILPNGSLADDFIIQREERQVHVLNAPSPAATSSLEIARYIRDLIVA